MGFKLKNVFKDIWGGVKDVAKIAAFVPGPVGAAGKAITMIDALTGGNKSSDAVQGYVQQGANAQLAYQQAALDQYQKMMDRQLATTTADKQMAYDISRGQYQANQQNILPYQQAALGSLQALPMLQQLLGVPAYNLSKTINQYVPPEVNYADLYRRSAEHFDAQSDTAGGVDSQPEGTGTTPTAAPDDNGIRVNILPNPDGSPQDPNTIKGGSSVSPGTSTPTTLEAYTGPAYDLENSPLYQWQKQQMEESLRGQLAASGLSGGTYAQRELARQNLGLAANERERVIGNLSSLVNLGMGGAGLSQSAFTPPQGGAIGNIYGQGGQDIAQLYGNMGHAQWLGSMQSAMLANAQAQQPSGLQTALQFASSQGWLNPGGSSSSSAGSIVGGMAGDLLGQLFSGGGSSGGGSYGFTDFANWATNPFGF